MFKEGHQKCNIWIDMSKVRSLIVVVSQVISPLFVVAGQVICPHCLLNSLRLIFKIYKRPHLFPCYFHMYVHAVLYG